MVQMKLGFVLAPGIEKKKNHKVFSILGTRRFNTGSVVVDPVSTWLNWNCVRPNFLPSMDMG